LDHYVVLSTEGVGSICGAAVGRSGSGIPIVSSQGQGQGRRAFRNPACQSTKIVFSNDMVDKHCCDIGSDIATYVGLIVEIARWDVVTSDDPIFCSRYHDETSRAGFAPTR
jgi:hypothetical protein